MVLASIYEFNKEENTHSQFMYQVDRIAAFNDNYIWALHNNHGKCAVVDPGDASPVVAYLEQQHLALTEILITHHHNDHIGGVKLLQEQFPNVKIYGPHTERFKTFATGVNEGDTINLLATGTNIQVIELHGHTRDHIGYIDKNNAFVGDTLFSAGCGRLFEGTASQMLQSLTKLAALPPSTQVFCAHEYTKSNLKFANAVEPNNLDVTQTLASLDTQITTLGASIPTTIEKELRINPFLRCHISDVQQNIATKFALKGDVSEEQTFASMRQWKDSF